MPTYEYRCSNCKHEMEAFQSITAKALKKCPECGKNALERLISGGGAILFKGGGFYETDYRSDSYKKAADADKKASEPGSSDKKPDAKGDSKPDSRQQSKPEKKPDTKQAGKPASDSKKSSGKSGT